MKHDPPSEPTYEPPRLTQVGLLRDLLLQGQGNAFGKSPPCPDGASGLSGNRSCR